jgi:hypothetical protein
LVLAAIEVQDRRLGLLDKVDGVAGLQGGGVALEPAVPRDTRPQCRAVGGIEPDNATTPAEAGDAEPGCVSLALAVRRAAHPPRQQQRLAISGPSRGPPESTIGRERQRAWPASMLLGGCGAGVARRQRHVVWMAIDEPMTRAAVTLHVTVSSDLAECMDTLRDKVRLEEIWATGKATWKVWS